MQLLYYEYIEWREEMETVEADINIIIALFHDEKPLTYSIEEIRLHSDDCRYVLYMDFSHERFVIKIAANNFTTVDRVTGWVDLIEEYSKIGYYSPAICKSLSGNYAERTTYKDKAVVVWEEEFAKYNFIDRDNINAEDEYSTRYQDGIIELFGKIGQKHLKGSFGKSGWVRLEPFGIGEEIDEVMECVETFHNLVREKAPHYLNRWQGILDLFEKNREELRANYHKLPTSVFQADWFESNLLIDDKGNLKGVIDYNLAGEDTVLNMFMSLGLFGFGSRKIGESSTEDLDYLNKENQTILINTMLDTFIRLKSYYEFSELEVDVAPLLYKYIVPMEYTQIQLFRDNIGDNNKLELILDFIEQELSREDIDFRSAMIGKE